MQIAVFLEIDKDHAPKYMDAFETRCRQAVKEQAWVIASKEYADKLPEEEKGDYLKVIPEDILKEVDENVEQAADRATLLVIQRNEKFENWLLELFGDDAADAESILANGTYGSIKHVAEEKHIAFYVEQSRNNVQRGEDKSSYYQNKVELLENNLSVLNERYKNVNESYYSLREYTTSTENYMKNLQVHATELDNELQAVTAENEQLKAQVEEIEQMRKENKTTLELYQGVLKELDERKVEVLELKSKYHRR